MDTTTISNCAVFDGVRIYENASVTIGGGKVLRLEEAPPMGEASKRFLMPGLIDGHTHLYTPEQMDTLVRFGVTATCSVDVSRKLADRSRVLKLHTSRTMALGNISDGRAYVEREIGLGADYIKVILEQPAIMAPKTMAPAVLRDIVQTAHAHGLKVAAHAVAINMVRLAVESGVDILIHVPMTEPFPEELAAQIAAQHMAIVPTLVMMKAFANDPRFSRYQPEHYPNAEAAVRLLHRMGVPILVGTDASDVPYVPKVWYGISMHQEMELLAQAGIPLPDVLRGATGTMADCFGIPNIGKIAPGYPADLILLDGRPDLTITDSQKLSQIWADGIPQR